MVESKIDIVKYVVEKLASLDNVTQYINSQNEQGNAPLHWAALNGHLEIVQLLVSSYGADMKVSIPSLTINNRDHGKLIIVTF
jgi:ankyrin repeat protein